MNINTLFYVVDSKLFSLTHINGVVKSMHDFDEICLEEMTVSIDKVKCDLYTTIPKSLDGVKFFIDACGQFWSLDISDKVTGFPGDYILMNGDIVVGESTEDGFRHDDEYTLFDYQSITELVSNI